MEHEEDSFAVEDFVCTPTDWGLQMSPPSPLPLSLQQDFENFDCTPTDLGLPMSPPPPLLPSDMNNTDVAQSAQPVKLQGAFELPDFTSTPTDVELLEDHLRPAIQRMQPEEHSFSRIICSPAVVNNELPSMNPWKLPGMIARNNKGGMRDKYFLTDHRHLVLFGFHELRTPNGFWKNQISDRVIRVVGNAPVGLKRTMKFHQYWGDDALSLSGTKANWIMNVYYTLDKNLFTEPGLVLCHVFEADSADYNDKCLGCHPGACNGNHYHQAFRTPSNASFNSPHPGSWPMNNDPDRHFDPKLNSYIAKLGNLLLGDPDDPDNSTDTGNCSARSGVDPPMPDHGRSKKRKKISDVWDYFTKIFARDSDGKVLTFAACNHCCKILTGSSKGGTTHLARHACPCKFKPVEAGRNAKGSGGDVNVLSS